MHGSVTKYDPQLTCQVPISGAITEGLPYGISGGVAVLATASHLGIIPALGYALRSMTSLDVAAGRVLGLAQQGIVNFAAGEIDGGALTPGATVYLSPTAGKVTSTRPTTAGDLNQVLGTAITATKVMVNVIPSGIVAQASADTTLTGA